MKQYEKDNCISRYKEVTMKKNILYFVLLLSVTLTSTVQAAPEGESLNKEKEVTLNVEVMTNTNMSYKDFGMSFYVDRRGVNVAMALDGGENVTNCEWYIERKTEKDVSKFRRVKKICDQGKIMTVAGEHIFLDKFPENRKLEQYYRVVIVNTEGKITRLPYVTLKKDPSN